MLRGRHGTHGLNTDTFLVRSQRVCRLEEKLSCNPFIYEFFDLLPLYLRGKRTNFLNYMFYFIRYKPAEDLHRLSPVEKIY